MKREQEGFVNDEAPVLHRVRTEDGHSLALWRFRAAGGPVRRHPVLLCHGLGSNRWSLDFPGRENLRRAFTRAGFEAWIVELRGSGASRAPLGARLLPRWTVDDYLRHDIPAALRTILDASRASGVHWVGHSLGGMLAYPILETVDASIIRSCVTIGSPILHKIKDPLFDRALVLEPFLGFIPVLPYGRLARIGAAFLGLATKALSRHLFNLDNIEVDVLKRLAGMAVDPVPMTVVRAFFEWYRRGEMRTSYGTLSVERNLSRIRTPLLVVAGAADGLTPPDDLRHIYERAASADKEFLLVGCEQGFSADYGHVDLVFGKRAPDEVYPRLVSWVTARDSAATAVVEAQAPGTTGDGTGGNGAGGDGDGTGKTARTGRAGRASAA